MATGLVMPCLIPPLSIVPFFLTKTHPEPILSTHCCSVSNKKNRTNVPKIPVMIGCAFVLLRVTKFFPRRYQLFHASVQRRKCTILNKKPKPIELPFNLYLIYTFLIFLTNAHFAVTNAHFSLTNELHFFINSSKIPVKTTVLNPFSQT